MTKTFTAATGTETFSRKSPPDLTHAVIGVEAVRSEAIAHAEEWLAKWGETGEAVLVKSTTKRLKALRTSDAHHVHAVRAWHSSEAAATAKRRVGEHVVAVAS